MCFRDKQHIKVADVNPCLVANEDGLLQAVSGEVPAQECHLSGIVPLLPTSQQPVALDTHQLGEKNAAALELMNLDKHEYGRKRRGSLVPAEGEEATVREHQDVSVPARVSFVLRATCSQLASIFNFFLGIS